MTQEFRPPRPGPDPAPDVIFAMPTLTELSSLVGSASLRADSEQQQQQQQQQQQNVQRRRFLNLESQLPEEEVVTRIAGEVRQINRIAPRQQR
jgi:hypothetical protein